MASGEVLEAGRRFYLMPFKRSQAGRFAGATKLFLMRARHYFVMMAAMGSRSTLNKPGCCRGLPRWALRLLLLAAQISFLGAAAGASVPLSAETLRLRLSPWIDTYRDAAGAVTLEQARQAYRDGKFQPCHQAWPSFGFTRDTIWLRFALQSDSEDARLWLAELHTSRMDELDWHLIHGDGKAEHLVAGNQRGRSLQVLDNKFPVFPVRLNPKERAEVFLRVRSETGLILPLELWSWQAFAESQTKDDAAYAAFFGYLAALILLSMVLSLFTRDHGYVLYSLSLIGVFMVYLINTGFYSWLGMPGACFAVKGGILIGGEGILVLMIAYLRHFFGLATTMPKLNRWLVYLSWSGVISAILLPLAPYNRVYFIMVLQLLMFGFGAMVLALVSWWQGNRTARFYFLAWFSFWIWFTVVQMQYFAWLPILGSPELQAILAVGISVTFFFLAMADRVKQVRLSLDQSQNKVIQLEQQSSRELKLQLRQEQQLIRDLHDGIGGLTANVAILAEMGRREASNEPERKWFEQIALLASEGGAEVRSLMSSMEAREMLWPDLIDECRRHGALVLNAHAIEFELTVAGNSDLPGPGVLAGMSLFRVFKETLTNAVKHSGASRVEALMEFSPGSFRLTVRDNGRGLGQHALGMGRGQANMACRIQELGGTMTSRGEKGTELIFEVPLPVKAKLTPETDEAGCEANVAALGNG